ncbi:MAG: serine/threonine protein kinase [Myxococcales bacterium]|nr:serine/threonine protein kinase [Myxococcales bacterium]
MVSDSTLGDTQPLPAGESASLAGLPRVGDVIEGKYEILEILGAGGMGVVVAARHNRLDERVAIKFLKPKAEGALEAQERFLREARACAKIKSEHVVRVMDCSVLPSGAPYILMEHLEGTDLAQHPRPIAVEDVVDWVLQACEAIAEAHALGFVHRDLKPSNLFLTRRGDGSACVKVLDFGISKVMPDVSGADPSLTDTQTVFGSPAYMSPEQVRSAKRADARSDVWALGVILYELLTGELPFRGETSSGTLAAIIADTPHSPGSLRREVSAELGGVILHCLEKDPNARFQNLGELARALRPHGSAAAAQSVERIQRLGVPRAPTSNPSGLSSQRTPAPSRASVPTVVHGVATIDPVETGSRAARRSRAPLAAVAVVAVVAVAGLVGAWALRSPAGPSALPSASGEATTAAVPSSPSAAASPAPLVASASAVASSSPPPSPSASAPPGASAGVLGRRPHPGRPVVRPPAPSSAPPPAYDPDRR